MQLLRLLLLFCCALQFIAAEAFGDLLYAQRRVWEALIPDEPFVDRRLLKLNEPIATDRTDPVASPEG